MVHVTTVLKTARKPFGSILPLNGVKRRVAVAAFVQCAGNPLLAARLLGPGEPQVTLDTRCSQDDEEHRLVALYEASRAKEHAAACRLLYPHLPHHNLPHQAYLKLVGDLGVMRIDCNEKMLAVRAHHSKMQGQIDVCAQPKLVCSSQSMQEREEEDS
jgi:hypothetical protein